MGYLMTKFDSFVNIYYNHVYIFNVSLQSIKKNELSDYDNHLFAQSYGIKYSYLIPIIYTQWWFKAGVSKIMTQKVIMCGGRSSCTKS